MMCTILRNHCHVLILTIKKLDSIRISGANLPARILSAVKLDKTRQSKTISNNNNVNEHNQINDAANPPEVWSVDKYYFSPSDGGTVVWRKHLVIISVR